MMATGSAPSGALSSVGLGGTGTLYSGISSCWIGSTVLQLLAVKIIDNAIVNINKFLIVSILDILLLFQLLGFHLI